MRRPRWSARISGRSSPTGQKRPCGGQGFTTCYFWAAWEILFTLFARPLVGVFTNDPAVAPLAVSCLRIVSYGNIGYAYAMVMLQAFNGAGDTLTPTILNLFGFWLFEIPLAYWLAIIEKWQASGVYFAIVIAEGIVALASIVVFRRGRWKQLQI